MKFFTDNLPNPLMVIGLKNVMKTPSKTAMALVANDEKPTKARMGCEDYTHYNVMSKMCDKLPTNKLTL